MPSASRLGDSSAGHGCFPPTPINGGCVGSVLINGIPAAISGSTHPDHKCGRTTHSGRTVSAGSGSVKIGGSPAARIGDAISCGDSMAAGSGSVFIGG